MELKVGDTIKIIKSLDFPDTTGQLCKVVMVMPKASSFACRVTGMTGLSSEFPYNMLMFDWEIEKVPQKGRQLLFDFMEQ